MIHCSLSFKVMCRWSLSSISILMISSDWSIAHWRSCWLVLMFHEITTFWDFAEASTEIRETRLLAVLLSRRAVHDSTDSESYVIVRKVRVDLIVVDLINLKMCFDKSNLKNFLRIFWIKVDYFVLFTRR